MNYLKALEIYEELNLPTGIAIANSGLAILAYSQGNYSEAIEIYDENIEIFSQKNIDSLKLAISYERKSKAYAQKGNYRIALIESMKGLKIMEQLDNPIRLADALNNLAGIEAYNENFEKSIEYNLEALRIYEEKNDKMYQAQALNDIGNTYFYLKNYTKAEDYLQRSIILSQEVGSLDLEATAFNNLGKTYMVTGLFDKALEVEYKSLEIVENTNSKLKIVESLNTLGQTYSMMGDPRSAISYYSRSIDLADSLQTLAMLGNAYKQRALARAEISNYKSAFQDLQLLIKARDSVFNKTKSQQIEELRTIYDTEKKEQQNRPAKN
jgi:tetratricopeptide (TPR) repeat protein